MTLSLANKKILLGVTGSIAAYKSADVVRRLREAGATVRVVMTENAKRFITPLTMQAVSGFPVHDELFDLHAEAAMSHIELARWVDMVLIAPATANFMAYLAHGHATDLLTTLCLATSAPIAVAPAMNQNMWQHVSTQANRRALLAKKIHIFGPDQGSQVCGDTGPGRMLEPVEIVFKVSLLFATGCMAGLNVLVTAGPTHEAIDPIRFVTNGSSGKMGYALAEAACEAGACVTLISGPVSLPKPANAEYERVVSAQEMKEAVLRNIATCDIFLAVAAVSDYRCQTVAKQKIHKQQATLQLTLERNPDIVAMVGELASKPFIVGFAAETEVENMMAQAQAKRERKNADMIIANYVGNDKGIGSDVNEVIVLTRDKVLTFSLTEKRKLARQLIALIAEEFKHVRS
jgi:phosphopantothenoylcysteine decarboxylase/phosphopantothenate--cysteine ligase